MKLSFGSKVQHGCNGTHTEDGDNSNHVSSIGPVKQNF